MKTVKSKISFLTTTAQKSKAKVIGDYRGSKWERVEGENSLSSEWQPTS
jgi:hypothetical protein